MNGTYDSTLFHQTTHRATTTTAVNFCESYWTAEFKVWRHVSSPPASVCLCLFVQCKKYSRTCLSLIWYRRGNHASFSCDYLFSSVVVAVETRKNRQSESFRNRICCNGQTQLVTSRNSNSWGLRTEKCWNCRGLLLLSAIHCLDARKDSSRDNSKRR